MGGCNVALEINPDSVKVYRVRGNAYAKLAKWEEAHKDISLAQQLDFNDDVADLQKLVKTQVGKLKAEAAAKRLREEQCGEENLLRRRKHHEERMRQEAEAKEAEAHERAERSLSRRCVRCCRRMRGKAPKDADADAADEPPDDAHNDDDDDARDNTEAQDKPAEDM